MVHESVLDVIRGGQDDDSDYEDGGEEEEEEAGQLRSGFKAMDITKASQEEGGGIGACDEDGGVVVVGGKERKERRKKSRKKRKGDRRKGNVSREQPMSIERFVVQTCRRIEETKYPLFREAVDRIGIDAMKVLLNQVDVIEKCGGQMTADGLRRRSAGGVLWNLLRDHVGAGLYKEIMKEGNRKHIEQQKARLKARENEKRPHVESEQEERQDLKRRRTSMDDGPTRRGVSRERRPGAGLRDEADNVRTPAALQHAWVQGLKKQGLGPKPSEGNAPSYPIGIKRPVSERIRMTVSYGDLLEEGQIATDSPIRGVTEDGSAGVEEADNVREEGEMIEEGEVAG